MLLSCPNCATSYEVDKSSLGSAGRSVRCLRCRHVWFASNAMAFAEIASAHREDLAALRMSFADAESPSADLPPMAAAADAVENGAALTSIEPPFEDIIPPTAATSALPYEAEPERVAAPVDGLIAAGIGTAVLTPSPAVGDLAADQSETGRGSGVDIETIAARRLARAAVRQRTRRLQGLTSAVLTLIAINVGLVAWRTDIVRWLPQTAALYSAIRLPVNLRGLEFANVKTKTETEDGVPLLVVTGEIVSASRRTVEVPRLRFAVRNQSGQEIYAWTALPSRPALAPGGELEFRSRLASPPQEGRQVLVRFFNRRDQIAGLP